MNLGNYENYLWIILVFLKLGLLVVLDEEINRGKLIILVFIVGGSGDNIGEYEIENVKSFWFICKSCNEKIEKGYVSEMLL